MRRVGSGGYKKRDNTNNGWMDGRDLAVCFLLSPTSQRRHRFLIKELIAPNYADVNWRHQIMFSLLLLNFIYVIQFFVLHSLSIFPFAYFTIYNVILYSLLLYDHLRATVAVINPLGAARGMNTSAFAGVRLSIPMYFMSTGT